VSDKEDTIVTRVTLVGGGATRGKVVPKTFPHSLLLLVYNVKLLSMTYDEVSSLELNRSDGLWGDVFDLQTRKPHVFTANTL